MGLGAVVAGQEKGLREVAAMGYPQEITQKHQGISPPRGGEAKQLRGEGWSVSPQVLPLEKHLLLCNSVTQT